ncbi:MAG: hypothetical protein WBE37_21630 [Bryobacteraceae bacterium]
MRHRIQWLLSGLMLAALTVSPASPQSRADVFVSFDHIVLPPAARKDIDTALLYLRLKNNSRNPIQVLVTAPEGGAEGVEVVHEIVEDGSPPPASGWISPPGHYSPASESTTADIQPNTDLLFSVPLNHVGPSWRLRIGYEIAAPKASPGRQQEGTVDFTWAGVPAKERGAWKK